MKLDAYRGKRFKGDPQKVAAPEPFGDEPAPNAASSTTSGAFVVHLHDATRRHYDLRLEIGGVLASFAVPHGLTLDPDKKHLAMKTEDHPLEYLEFEDVIPAGQYGAGPMIVWDRGFVEYLEGPAEEEVTRGKLDLRLQGFKLRGRFALVRLAKGNGAEWLLFKKNDEHASKARDVTAELPASVLSGMTVDRLADAGAIGQGYVARARAAGGAALGPTEAARLLDPSTSPLLAPAAAPREGPPSSRSPQAPGTVYDPELDGIRVLATRDGDIVTLRTYSATGEEERIEGFYPETVRALRALPCSRLALDGQLVAFDASGHPSLTALAQRVERIGRGDVHRAVTTTPVVFVVTDLLGLGSPGAELVDVRGMPLEARRDLLSSMLPNLGVVRASAPLDGDLATILAFSAEHGIEAVVAKKKGSPYAPGKKPPWSLVSSGLAPRSRSRVDHHAPDARAALRRVTVTNRAKVFWPDEGYTKGDLTTYYANVADVILPYLKDRPIIVVRYPDGITGKNFFQWNVPPGMPAWVRTLSIPGETPETTRRGFLVDDASTLLYLANLACIPLHVLGARAPNLGAADFLTLDFDVKQSTLANAITLALELREILDVVGLQGFPKTSGQTGLHVLVPLGKGQSWDTARALADLLGRLLVDRHPEIATMDRTISRRGARVYVDTGQTGPSRAIVAPYSVRAVPGARVSTPLAWDEVTAELDPGTFTLATVPQRIAERGDPMASLLDVTPDVVRAVGKLAEVVARARG